MQTHSTAGGDTLPGRPKLPQAAASLAARHAVISCSLPSFSTLPSWETSQGNHPVRRPTSYPSQPCNIPDTSAWVSYLTAWGEACVSPKVFACAAIKCGEDCSGAVHSAHHIYTVRGRGESGGHHGPRGSVAEDASGHLHAGVCRGTDAIAAARVRPEQRGDRMKMWRGGQCWTAALTHLRVCPLQG